METNIESVKLEVSSILFSKSYLDSLRKTGFSKEFILNEQMRKMKECINYLLGVIAEFESGKSGSRKDLVRIYNI
ncbi:MAG: hypothetical protein M1409_03035 [Actinobacteria bacterium]|nr:hypothetical protein [Actinomycetota bacterium]